MAKELELSSSFLSSIEYGRRIPPEGFHDTVTERFELKQESASELSKLYAHAREKFSINPHEQLGREATVAFARRVNNIPENKLQDILKILRELDDEQPFPSGIGALNYVVSPRSWQEIDRLAQNFRRRYSVEGDKIDVMNLLENQMYEKDGVCLEVRSEAEMGLTEGITDFNGDTITLREDVYEGAWKGNSRARFTVSHEVGHFVLHRGQITGMARMSTTADKDYVLSEPQANRFAACLLMPKGMFNSTDRVSNITDRFGVSKTAARIRLKEYRRDLQIEGPELLF